MAKDYLKVEPDRVSLLGRNFTAGRGGRKIRYITLHHTAGVLDAAGINRVWRDRPASAHYLIGTTGIVSQHVWDRDTAWSNANSVSNAESITIEHSNSAGAAQDWPINQATLDEGARWTAALCLYYDLGRPEIGKNVRTHNEFTSTSCPYHLRRGQKYHDRYMAEARRFYDELVHRKNGTTPSPTPPKETPDMAEKRYPGFVDPEVDGTIADWVRHADRNSFYALQEVRMLRGEIAALREALTGQAYSTVNVDDIESVDDHLAMPEQAEDPAGEQAAQSSFGFQPGRHRRAEMTGSDIARFAAIYGAAT